MLCCIFYSRINENLETLSLWVPSLMVSKRFVPGMVSTRMETRFEALERDHANFKREFNSVKDVVMEIRNTLERPDNKIKNLESGPLASQTARNWAIAEEQVAE